jgi:murein DD-endopeptidase MepM/ murein hydrolase activator NlpD
MTVLRSLMRPLKKIVSLAAASATTLVLSAPISLPVTGPQPAPSLQAAPRKNPGPRKRSTVRAWSKFDCGQGVELRLSAANSIQGSLLLAELRSPKPLTGVSGTWDERGVSFWQEPPASSPVNPAKSSAAPQALEIRRAFVGVDLEKPVGSYDFAATATTASGDPVTCRAPIVVKAGKFATERLKVAPNFVEPNPEQLAKAEEDRKKLRELYATVTPEKLWQGRFRVPLDGVTTGGNFGHRRVLNGTPSSPHTGVDFPVPTGTLVHAAQRGRVVLAEELYFSGNTVIVDHGLGVYTLYGHFSEIDVKPGDTVNVGEVIGKVGATGRVTGPHLHWGLTVNHARVNALSIVRLATF